jgi:hypothetical protein
MNGTDALLFESLFDLFGDCIHLASTFAIAQHEIIGESARFLHVQQYNIGCLLLRSCFDCLPGHLK